jgi:hypothetical protein
MGDWPETFLGLTHQETGLAVAVTTDAFKISGFRALGPKKTHGYPVKATLPTTGAGLANATSDCGRLVAPIARCVDCRWFVSLMTERHSRACCPRV